MSFSVSGICRLTRDAEIRKQLDTGSFITIGVATHRKNKKEGRQEADFFELEYFCRSATDANALLAQLKKGTRIYINSAILQRDEYQDANGEKKYKFRVSVFSFDLLDVTRPAAPQAAQPVTAQQPAAAPRPVAPKPAAPKPVAPPPPDPVVDTYAQNHTVESFDEAYAGPDQDVPW